MSIYLHNLVYHVLCVLTSFQAFLLLVLYLFQSSTSDLVTAIVLYTYFHLPSKKENCGNSIFLVLLQIELNQIKQFYNDIR